MGISVVPLGAIPTITDRKIPLRRCGHPRAKATGF